jgi:hypothetical protein
MLVWRGREHHANPDFQGHPGNRNLFTLPTLVLLLLVLIHPRFSPAYAIDTQNITNTTVSSGKGGLEFGYDCLNGFLLSGIDANVLDWRNKKVLSQLRGSCVEVASNGKATVNNLAYTQISGLAETGIPNSIDCPKSSVVIGAKVYNFSDPIYVSGIRLICGNLNNGNEVGVTKVIGAESSLVDTLRCPDDTFAFGLQMRYGEIVDAFGLVCSNIKDAEQSPLTSVVFSSNEKQYPYSEEIQIRNSVGGSGTGRVYISNVTSSPDSTKCVYKDGVISSTEAGTCLITVTKAGDKFYGPTKFQTTFVFSKATDTISLDALTLKMEINELTKEFVPTISRSSGLGVDSEDLAYVARDGTAIGCQVAKSTESTSEFVLRVTSNTFGTCLISASIIDNPNFLNSNSNELEALFTEPAKVEQSTIEKRGTQVFKTYNPIDDAKNVVDLQVAGFALLALIASGAAASSAFAGGGRGVDQSARREDDERDRNSGEEESNDNKESDSERESGDVASASGSKISFHQRNIGIGDKSRLWQLIHVPKFEQRFKKVTQRLSGISPIASRIFIDGSYLRAMFSGLSIFSMLSGLAVGIVMVQETDQQPIPASLTLVVLGLVIATLDAIAGLLIAIVVTVATAISGNINTLDEAMTIIGLAALFITPGLVANSVRPLRRLIITRSHVWERITDYFLATLIGGWSTEKIVTALNGLSGIQLPITSDARLIGQCVAFAILIRLLLEDIATYFFPQRLAEQEVSIGKSNAAQPWLSLIFKITLFYLIAFQFLGYGNQLLIGTAIFALPQVLSLLLSRFDYRKSKALWFLIPRGAPKLVIMVFVGGFFAHWVESQFDSPQEYLTWSFVLLAIPGLIIALITLFAVSPQWDWYSRRLSTWIYRVGGLSIAVIIFLMYMGVDIYAQVFGAQ